MFLWRNFLRDTKFLWMWLLLAAIEFSERLCYFGIATSLIIYLTRVIHQDLKTAAKSCNYWIGVTTMMPLLGGFLADAYLGRFSTVLASCVFYFMVSNLKSLFFIWKNIADKISYTATNMVYYNETQIWKNYIFCRDLYSIGEEL